MPFRPLSKKDLDESVVPVYGSRSLKSSVPKFKIPKKEMSPREAYDLVHDQLMLDGNARLNLATFVTTWMEPEARDLMSETFDKNMIDKDEYPQTAAIELRCVMMLAQLWNSPNPENSIGCSTTGSSEACMLAGLAMKWRWRQRREKMGLTTDRPNLVMGINVQICWEKFCRYWDVEMRLAPMEEGSYTLNAEKMKALCDENTIGVVGILGSTFTGEYEPIKELNDALVKLNKQNNWDIPIHVDGASGAMVAPFLQPKLKWDFRLSLVKSINTSGHKFGLVYPGVGWVVWREKQDLPEDLIFNVNYLGGQMPTFALNFSRPGNQVIAQYYNFLRLGEDGYYRIHKACQDVALHISKSLPKIGPFEVLHDGSDLPVMAWKIKKDADVKYTVFDLSEHLRMHGWQIPAYTLPAHLEDIAIMRVVVKEGMSMELANLLLEHIERALKYFEARAHHTPLDVNKRTGFHH